MYYHVPKSRRGMNSKGRGFIQNLIVGKFAAKEIGVQVLFYPLIVKIGLSLKQVIESHEFLFVSGNDPNNLNTAESL